MTGLTLPKYNDRVKTEFKYLCLGHKRGVKESVPFVLKRISFFAPL